MKTDNFCFETPINNKITDSLLYSEPPDKRLERPPPPLQNLDPPPPTLLLNLEPSSLSDHSPIMTWLNINTVNNQLTMENTNHTLFVYPNSLYGKMIHDKNLRRHCRQETYRE